MFWYSKTWWKQCHSMSNQHMFLSLRYLNIKIDNKVINFFAKLCHRKTWWQQCIVDDLCVYYCATFNYFIFIYILKVNCMFYISTVIMLLEILLYTNKDYYYYYFVTARHGGSPAAARPAPGSHRPRRPHPGQLRTAAVPGRQHARSDRRRPPGDGPRV